MPYLAAAVFYESPFHAQAWQVRQRLSAHILSTRYTMNFAPCICGAINHTLVDAHT